MKCHSLAATIFMLAILPMGCWGEDPWALTNGLPEVDPGKPVEVHFCINNTTAPEKYLKNLCTEYPYSWAEGCEANKKLQTCEEFVVALGTSCPKQDTCDYEKCSMALQLAPCGEWPETCQQVVSCVDPEWPPPMEDSPTTG